MTAANLGLISLGTLLFAAWATLGSLIIAGSRKVRPLKEVIRPEPPRSRPSLSVVVTARDEAAAIETTIRRLLAQRYPELEIIVVDDRSTDGTSEILDRLAAEPGTEDGRLVVIHNKSLPEGWLGKCHACHVGARRARGEWILFTDGDVSLIGDDLLARTVAHAAGCGLDHVAVLPDLRPMPPVQTGLVAVFGQMFLAASRVHEMDRDLSRGGTGVGAFNLVRRAAYERVGGHRRLRMDLADDFKLGRLLKESGARQRLYIGIDLVLCRWHSGALNTLRGLEKNFFAGFDYSIVLVIAATLAILAVAFGPMVVGILVTMQPGPSPGPWTLAAAWLPFALQALFVITGYTLEAPRHGFRPLVLILMHPLAILLLLGAIWNSSLSTLARGGVRWRNTFYPLEALRRGQVPTGAGRAPMSGTEGENDPKGG